jgi:hypothetical protein
MTVAFSWTTIAEMAALFLVALRARRLAAVFTG